MSAWPIVLVGLLVAVQAWPGAEGVLGGGRPGVAWLVAWSVSVKAGLVVIGWWRVHRAMRARRDGRGAFVSAEAWVRRLRGLVLVSLALDLGLGWLGAVRAGVGDWVGVDEAVAALPALGAWWGLTMAAWPLERRVREARLIGAIDDGGGLTEEMGHGLRRGAWGYAADRARMEWLPLLVVMGLAMGWQEAIDRWAGGRGGAWWVEGVRLSGVLAVLLALPWLVRWSWGLSAMRGMELAEELGAAWRAAGCRAGRVMMWRPAGGQANAAVVGLIGWGRVVMVSEALVEGLTADQRAAVIGHEAGHVRHRHMVWLGASSVALVMLGGAGAKWVALTAGLDAATAEAVALGAGLAVWGWGFGVVSRMAERQADAHAVRALSEASGFDDGGAGAGTTTDAAVAAMSGALGRVAVLNGAAESRWTWRHGSIASRRRALSGLIGREVNRYPADAAMRWAKRATFAGLAAAAGLWWVGWI
ncbi:MAG: M48 family metalloprotease [Planctomycetota bacterium]